MESGHGASMHMAASSRARSLVAKVSLECACLGQVSTVRPRVFFGASVVWQLFPSCGTWQVYLQAMAILLCIWSILSRSLSSVRAVGTMSSVRAVGFGFHGKLANQQQTTISNHNKVTSSSSAHIGKGDGCESQHVAQYIAVGASSQGGLFCCL